MIHVVEGWRKVVQYERVIFEVDTTTKDDALVMVKQHPDDFVDTYDVIVRETEYIKQEEWE